MKRIFHCGMLYLIIPAIFLIGCNNYKSKKISSVTKIDPGFARIIGTVIKIDSSLDKNKPMSPCGKVPCTTKVKIDSILGYGSAFGKPLNIDTNIKLKFMFTTKETSKDLFPNIYEHLPGVKVGSKFLGNIQEIKSTINTNKINYSRLYKIYKYKTLKN